jgi:dipeptidyl aminopeptidase/acylaminoacyl peptidase
MTDNLLDTAIANWGPRFTANGVDPGDYERLTSSIATWDDWCAAWCAGAEEHLRIAEQALARGHRLSAGESFSRAATYFHFAKFMFVHDLDQARAAHARAVDALTQALPRLSPPGRRIEIAFEGSTLVGVLRLPAGRGPHPTVLLIPGLDSTKEELRDVERVFLDRHMATFAFDGPGQGEAEWTLPLRPEWDEVGAVVLDKLRDIHEVDSERIGVWGVSLGGFYAARVAASDLPVRATVALCPPYNLGATWPRLNPLTRHAFEVRSFSSSAEAAERRSHDITLAGWAERITTPLLVIAGKRDRLFPWEDGARIVEEARGEAELLALDEGNHGCANVIPYHRPYCADWMADHLHASSS